MSYIDSFTIPPSSFFQKVPRSEIEMFRPMQHVLGMFYVYKILGEQRYLDLAMKELEILDEAAWLGGEYTPYRGYLDRYASLIDKDGNILDEDFNYMDADMLNVLPLAYNLTGEMRWKNRLDAHLSVLMERYFDGYAGVYHKPVLDGRYELNSYDVYHMRFPDTLLAALDYARTWIPSDSRYGTMLSNVVANSSKYRGPYGYGQTWNGVADNIASPTYYEYMFFESPFIDLPSHLENFEVEIGR